MLKDCKQYHIMPIIAPMTPLAGKPQGVGGGIRWQVTKWDETEYAQMQKDLDIIFSLAVGKEIKDLVTSLAENLLRKMPDREWSVSLGSFVIEHKPSATVLGSMTLPRPFVSGN